jgi:toxin ParE1/3/4
MKPAILSTRARRDFVEAINWISKDNPTAAKALRDAVRMATINLGEFPLSGQERPELSPPPARFLMLSGFSYVIVYDAQQKPPVVLRILHGARDLPELLEGLSS